MNSIFQRKSIRTYVDKEVKSIKIENILKAGMQAPSAGNQQGWEFLIIKDKEKLKELSKMSLYSKMIENCNVAIIVLGNKNNMKFPQYWEQDLGAACQNILLQVVEEGLGAVWLGVAPEEERMQYIVNMFSLPQNICPYAVIPIGYPLEKNHKISSRWNKEKVYYDNYIK